MESFALEPQMVPLQSDEHGGWRIGKSRVSLDTVIETFKEGATPEEIVQNFDTLLLADVYAVIGYYLKNTDAVESYLEKRRKEADQIHSAWAKAWPDHANYRQLLLARLAAKERQNAAPPQ